MCDHSLPIQDHYFTVSQPQGKFCWFISLLLKYYMEFLLSLQDRIKISILELFFFQMLPPNLKNLAAIMGNFISVGLECQSINAWGALPLSAHKCCSAEPEKNHECFLLLTKHYRKTECRIRFFQL